MTTDELRALMDRATPEPWDYDRIDGALVSDPDSYPRRLLVDGVALPAGPRQPQAEHNAAFICAVRNELSGLLDRLAAAEAVAAAFMRYHEGGDENDVALMLDYAAAVEALADWKKLTKETP